MPVLWGGIEVGQGPGDDLAAGYPVRTGSNPVAVEQNPVGMSGTLLPTRVVHRGDHAGAGPVADHAAATTAIGAAIGDAARSVADVAAAHLVSWPTAHRAFIAHAQAQLAEPAPTSTGRTRTSGDDRLRRLTLWC